MHPVRQARKYWRFLRPRWASAKIYLIRTLTRLVPNESQRLFILTLIVGAGCGLAAVAFHLSIIWFEDNLIVPALASPHYFIWGIVTPLAGGLLCGVALKYLVPGARGSGIPQVKVAYAIGGGYISVREAIGKFVIGGLQIGSGGSLGREGPTVHICAGLASFLGRVFALSQKSLRRLLPVGAAAGIAAAFNAPIAAVTFTIEEVVGDLDQTVLSGVIVAAAIAAAIERSILGEHPVFSLTDTYGLTHASSLFFYGVLGICGGGVSLAFTGSLLWLRSQFLRSTSLPSWLHPAIGGGGTTGLFAVIAVYALGIGGINGGGYDTLSQALSGSIGFKVMAALCVLKIFATVFSYGSGGAGGIFAPALFIGGMLGGVIGFLDERVLAHSDHQIGAFALVGMGAVFAGVVRAPITSVLIIFEMTGSYGLILPLMIANMTSYAVAKRFSATPIYEALLEQDGIHLPHRKGSLSHALSDVVIANAMIENAVTLEAEISVQQAMDLAQKRSFTTFPVIDLNGEFIGNVTEMRLRRTVAAGDGAEPLSSIVSEAYWVHPNEPLSRALVVMSERHIRQLAVLSSSEPMIFLGIITMADIVSAQATMLDEHDGTKPLAA